MAAGGQVPGARRARRIWRTRFRPAWREARLPVLAGLAVAAWVLGYWGFTELDDDHAPAYRAFQLFALDAGDVEEAAPPQLEIARLLAPFVALFAAIGALFTVFAEQLQFLRVRLLTRQHTVIAGLGSKGSKLAFALHEAGSRLVVIELDRTNGFIAGCRERGIPVLVGDAADQDILRKARTGRARYAVVLCGDDGTNLDVLAALSVPNVFVHLDSLDLRRTLAAEALGAPRTRIHLELFNIYEIAAGELLERFPTGPSMLVVGGSGLGESLILRAANTWHASEPRPPERLRVTVLADDAPTELERLLERFPELGKVCSFHPVRGDPCTSGLDLGADRFTGVYVSVEDQSGGLEAALALNDRAEVRGSPVVLVIESEDAGSATLLRDRLGPPPDLHTFGILDQALTPDLLLRGTNELLAMARHDDYVRDELAKGATAAESPALVPWTELPGNYKRANRHFAADIGRKLSAVGCALRPAPLAAVRGDHVVLTEAEVEKLGRMEHDRWSEERKRAGWRPTDGPRDDERKLHPLIDKPWEELSAEDRAKDSEPMRDLPRSLARAGFEVFRL